MQEVQNMYLDKLIKKWKLSRVGQQRLWNHNRNQNLDICMLIDAKINVILICKALLFCFFSEIIPNEIGNLKGLEHLSLDGNLLTRLPDSVSQLSNLRTLNVSENKLTHFPEAINTLKNLDAVNLSRNKITEVPGSVGTCQAIELNLNQNQVHTLDTVFLFSGRSILPCYT